MSRFRLSRSANDDLESIWEYIAADNPDAADRLIEQFHDAFQWLANYPRAGHKRQDMGDRPVLFWPEGRYEIIYRPFPGFIEIDAILHGSRDIPAVLRDREDE
jgi:plasmid stabilization system protein ParE